MSEKKVVVFIVEGPSDEAALGSVMKECFSGHKVQFVVVHGDITLKDHVSADNILKKINEQIEGIKNRYRYRQDDFIKIIHIADTDGVYIPEADVKDADVEGVQYYEDHIDAGNAGEVTERNKRKGSLIPAIWNMCCMESLGLILMKRKKDYQMILQTGMMEKRMSL